MLRWDDSVVVDDDDDIDDDDDVYANYDEYSIMSIVNGASVKDFVASLFKIQLYAGVLVMWFCEITC